MPANPLTSLKISVEELMSSTFLLKGYLASEQVAVNHFYIFQLHKTCLLLA
jgi:hypothetical protein